MAVKLSEIINFRTMRMEDLWQGCNIEKKSYDHPWSEKVLKNCLLYKYDCYVAIQQGIILGYFFSQISYPETHLLNLTVDKDYRNHGIATEFMNLILSKAKTHKSESIILETRETNDAAIKLYKKFKFKSIGIRPRYYRTKNGWEDALVFCREINYPR